MNKCLYEGLQEQAVSKKSQTDAKILNIVKLSGTSIRQYQTPQNFNVNFNVNVNEYQCFFVFFISLPGIVTTTVVLRSGHD
jgi:hypothetical protein